jgi:hypothetical protein
MFMQHCCLLRGREEQSAGWSILLPSRGILKGKMASSCSGTGSGSGTGSALFPVVLKKTLFGIRIKSAGSDFESGPFLLNAGPKTDLYGTQKNPSNFSSERDINSE